MSSPTFQSAEDRERFLAKHGLMIVRHEGAYIVFCAVSHRNLSMQGHGLLKNALTWAENLIAQKKHPFQL